RQTGVGRTGYGASGCFRTASSKGGCRHSSEGGIRMTHSAIVMLGEPMIEFNQTRMGDRHYLQGFGGDTSNAVIAAARQGASSGYLTKLGDDEFGRLLLRLWQSEKVDTRGVRTDPQ